LVRDILHHLVKFSYQRGFLADKTTPTFSFDPNNANRINQVDDLGLQSSRWQMQVGVRYSFSSILRSTFLKSPSFQLEMRTFV
jgi:hypothetical protein